jgi:hypothetical protein
MFENEIDDLLKDTDIKEAPAKSNDDEVKEIVSEHEEEDDGSDDDEDQAEHVA